MIEGWHGEDYLILFASEEVPAATERYGIRQRLPDHEVLGLRSWDDLIVRSANGNTYCVPAVPIDPKYASPFKLPDSGLPLDPDTRFTGKIKWHTKPLVFGGDPGAGDNLTWVGHEQHGQLVNWWNGQYEALRAKSGGA